MRAGRDFGILPPLIRARSPSSRSTGHRVNFTWIPLTWPGNEDRTAGRVQAE
jgi:hypothetical protein